MLSFVLPQPPSVNKLYANRKQAGKRGRVKTDAYSTWIRDAGWLAKTAVVGKPRPTGNIEVEYLVSGDKRFDAGNLEKPLSDLLVRVGIIADDKHITSIRIARREDTRPEVNVTVKEAA